MRGGNRVLLVVALAAASCPLWAQSGLTGIWRIDKPVAALHTANGGEPPLRAEAAKRYQVHIAERRNGDLTSFDSAAWCASVGMPRIMTINSPFEIVVRPPYVALLHEWNWWARVVYFGGALAGGDDQPGPMGLSVGRWEGDTLVVETSHLIGSTLIDNSGLPHSDALKLTERLRLRSPDVLEDRLQFEDPQTFTQPWEAVLTYRRQHTDIHEDVCLDRIKSGEPALMETDR